MPYKLTILTALLVALRFGPGSACTAQSIHVYDMALGPDVIYVAGDFQVDGVVTSALMMWSNDSWHNVDLPDIVLKRMEYTGGDLFVSGWSLENTRRTHLYRQDSGSWTLLGEFVEECCDNIEIIVVRSLGPDSIAVGGTFTNVDGTPMNSFAIRGASGWSSLGADFIGFPFIENAVDNVYDILPLGDTLVVAGAFKSVSGTQSRRIAGWSNGSWVSMGAGLGDSVSTPGVNSLAVHDGSLYAGGNFDSSGVDPIKNVGRWTGESWAGAGIPGNSITVYSLASHSDQLLYAGGIFSDSVAAPAGIAVWDGVEWSNMGTGIAGTVRSIVIDQDYVYVGGRFDSAGSVAANSIARWDGNVWSALGGGLVVSTSVDPGDQQLLQFEIYPNPFSSTIRISGMSSFDNVSVFDSLGRLLHSSSESVLDLSVYPAGLYFVRVSVGTSIQVRPVVKVEP